VDGVVASWLFAGLVIPVPLLPAFQVSTTNTDRPPLKKKNKTNTDRPEKKTGSELVEARYSYDVLKNRIDLVVKDGG
jgi:hypothetical protein